MMVWAPAFLPGGWRRAGYLAEYGGRRGSDITGTIVLFVVPDGDEVAGGLIHKRRFHSKVAVRLNKNVWGS